MKKIKFILPVVAIVFAVVGVFATDNSTSALTAQNVTLGQENSTPNCIKDGTCSNTGSPTCVTASGLILKVRVDAESCSANSTGTFTYAP
jgi:hypothetical protein